MKESTLGEGAYGCVVIPNIPCNDANKENKNEVSKILKIKDNKEKESFIQYNKEYKIGKKLEQIDKEKIFFLGGNDICKIKKNNIANKKIKDAIDNCFKKKSGINREIFFNITLNKGYNFRHIFYKINTNTNIFLIIGLE